VLYEKRNMNNEEKKMIWSRSISILKNYPCKKETLRVFVQRVVKEMFRTPEGGSNMISME
jgi:hypothetical protein